MNRINNRYLSLSSTLLIVLIFSSCVTNSPESWTGEERLQSADQRSRIQEKLIDSAEHYRGTTSGTLTADDRTYCLDCSSSLLAIYYLAGIDLERCYTDYEGNGVRRLYSALRDNKLIFNAKIPQAGDLIFWDNTWDQNDDGKYNDYFTHTGMVVDVTPDGTITYIHHNYRKGLVYEQMNLFHPDDTRLNSPMRMRGSPPAPEGQYLASHLVRVFGRAWQLPRSYWR